MGGLKSRSKSRVRIHSLKSGQIRGFFWSIFSCTRTKSVSLRIQSECREIKTRKNSISGHLLRSDSINFTSSDTNNPLRYVSLFSWVYTVIYSHSKSFVIAVYAHNLFIYLNKLVVTRSQSL